MTERDKWIDRFIDFVTGRDEVSCQETSGKRSQVTAAKKAMRDLEWASSLYIAWLDALKNCNEPLLYEWLCSKERDAFLHVKDVEK